MWKIAAFIAVTLAALAAVYLIPHKNQISQKPCPEVCNVILIVVDALGAKHIGTYGYSRDTMPQTEAFFEKNGGIIFENAESAAPWTLPSFTSLYFSDLASRITYRDLRDSRENLVNVLRDNGTRIRGVVPARTLFIYDAIDAPFLDDEIRGYLYDRDHIASSSKKVLNSLIKEPATTPFFMVVHSLGAHDPYDPNEPFNHEFEELQGYQVVSMDDILQSNVDIEKKIPGAFDPAKRDAFTLRYDQNIARTDADLAEFLNAIPKKALNDTVIILTADHGEAFLEHDRYWHSQSLFDEELHVPLIIRVPQYGLKRIVEPVSILDLAPTILSFMHTPTPAAFIGKDLTPLIQGRSLGKRVIPFINGKPKYLDPGQLKPGMQPPATLKAAGVEGTEKPVVEPSMWGVREGSIKVFSSDDGLHAYDLASDPDEKKNLYENGLIPAELMHEVLKLGAFLQEKIKPRE